jgi:hypothetical protein
MDEGVQVPMNGPQGRMGERLRRVAADAPNRTSPFRWGRFEASQSDTGPTLQAKLDGWYTWMETGRRMFPRRGRIPREADMSTGSP